MQNALHILIYMSLWFNYLSNPVIQKLCLYVYKLFYAETERSHFSESQPFTNLLIFLKTLSMYKLKKNSFWDSLSWKRIPNENSTQCAVSDTASAIPDLCCSYTEGFCPRQRECCYTQGVLFQTKRMCCSRHRGYCFR